MAAYRRVYDSRHLHADCTEPESAPEPYARQSSMGCLYLFFNSPSLDYCSTSEFNPIQWRIQTIVKGSVSGGDSVGG